MNPRRALLALLAVACATPLAVHCARPAPAGNRVVLESGHVVDPTGAYRILEPHADPRGVVLPTQKLKLIAAVKQNPEGLASLRATFDTVSDPRSKDYGRHMTKEEVDDLTAPPRHAVDAVAQWIESHAGARVVDETARGGFIYFEAPVATVEFMLACRVAVYEHVELRRTAIRAVGGRYSVPEHVAQHLDFVGGLSAFPHLNEIVRRVKASEKIDNGANPADLGLTVDPSLLRHRYKSAKLMGDEGKNGVASSITALIGQYYSEFDLEAFNAIYARYNIGHGITKVIGPNIQSDPGVEALLDTQYMTAMAPHTNTWFWSIDAASQDPFLEWISQIGNTTNPPQVHSTSYGGAESGIPESYALRLDSEFQKAGVRGLSLIFASGDNAVGCSTDKTTFEPDWPASSSFVTALGATSLSGVFETGNEIVAPFSGGGSSNRYARPRYQEAAVEAYLKNPDAKLPPAHMWNQTGRVYPDAAALGVNYSVFFKGAPRAGVAGTSCSSPVFGALISLLNTQRKAAGKSTLGFLNPVLYENIAAFTDVDRGSNPACGTDGFHAVKGYDLPSGVGTPNAEALLKVVMALP